MDHETSSIALIIHAVMRPAERQRLCQRKRLRPIVEPTFRQLAIRLVEPARADGRFVR